MHQWFTQVAFAIILGVVAIALAVSSIITNYELASCIASARSLYNT